MEGVVLEGTQGNANQRPKIPFTKQCGTRNWMDPEMLKDPCRYDGCMADAYSLGVILYNMVTGGAPYTDPYRSDQLFTLIYE